MRGRAAFVYTPEKTKAYQQLVGWEARKVCKQPLTGPVEVSMKLFSRSRFDLDNVAKSILDGMCGICYVDDVQVEVLHVTKQAVKNKRGGDRGAPAGKNGHSITKSMKSSAWMVLQFWLRILKDQFLKSKCLRPVPKAG